MRNSQKIALAALVVILLILGRLFHQSQHKTEPSPKAVTETAAPATSAARATTQVPTPALTSEKSPDEIPADAKSGLCKANLSGDRYQVISMNTYQQLKSKKTQLLVLPRHQGDCFPDEGQIQAHIVHYSTATDRAFDYLGDCSMVIKRVVRAKNFEELIYNPAYDLAKLGFKSHADVLDFLKKEGSSNKDAVDLYEISSFGSVTPRKPTGSYSFYPYVKMIDSYEKVKAQREDGSLKIVDLRFDDSKDNKIGDAITLPLADLGTQPLLNPTALTRKLDAAALDPSLKDKELLLLSFSGFQRLPYNAVQILLNSGFTKISILQQGYADLKNWHLATPGKINKMMNARYSGLEDILAKSVVIDTRLSQFRSSFIWDGAVNVPVRNPVQGIERYDDFTNYHKTQAFGPQYDISDRFRMNDIKKLAEGKNIVLIGQNEYDWGPVIFYESFRKVRTSRVYWLRTGFEGLAIRDQLGILNADLAAKLKSRTEVLASAKDSIKNTDGVKMHIIAPPSKAADDNPFSRRRHKDKK